MHAPLYWLALAVLFFLPQPRPAGDVETIRDIGLVSEGVGWLQAGNRLVWTANEGQDWRELGTVEGELLTADFVSPLLGWVIAIAPGMTGDDALTMARTRDGGVTWQRAALSLSASDYPDLIASGFELNFADADQGILRIDHPSSSNFERWSEWRTIDGGTTWEHLDSGGRHDLLAHPLTDDRTAAAETLAGGYAWRRYDEGRCEDSGTGRRCRSVNGVRVTHDDGRTWIELPLPKGVGGERQWTVDQAAAGAAATEPNRTAIASGQGFDKCEIATLEQLLDWRANSPYSAVNLYIGGVMAVCSNRGLNADYLRTLKSMGWTFIPTWVGPQSPCFPDGRLISTNPAVAQGQGVVEANAAADTLARLGLAEEDGTGSIVYYDMEYYPSSESCNASVQAFMTGWTQQLQSRGHLSGVYGVGSMLRLLANLAPPPNAIWAANWVYSSYEPSASVWDVYNLPDGLWVYHQRLRQYTGGHNETWGTTTLNIDSNALDGPVAVIGPAPRTATPAARVYLPLILTD